MHIKEKPTPAGKIEIREKRRGEKSRGGRRGKKRREEERREKEIKLREIQGKQKTPTRKLRPGTLSKKF